MDFQAAVLLQDGRLFACLPGAAGQPAYVPKTQTFYKERSK